MSVYIAQLLNCCISCSFNIKFKSRLPILQFSVSHCIMTQKISLFLCFEFLNFEKLHFRDLVLFIYLKHSWVKKYTKKSLKTAAGSFPVHTCLYFDFKKNIFKNFLQNDILYLTSLLCTTLLIIM